MRLLQSTRSVICLGFGATLALAGAARADDLTDAVVKALQAQLPAQIIIVKDANELQVKDGDGASKTVYLDNLRKACSADPAACDAATADFVRHISPLMPSAVKPAVFVREKIYPVLRRRGMAAQVAQMSNKPGNVLVERGFVSDVELLFVIDGENSLQYVTVDELTAAGLTSDAMMALGAGNATHLPTVQPQPVAQVDGVFVLVYGDSLGTARLFDTALWDKIEAGAGGPVAAVAVTRDWILYTRLDEAARVAELRRVAARVVEKQAYGVSSVVIKRRGATWTPVPEN